MCITNRNYLYNWKGARVSWQVKINLILRDDKKSENNVPDNISVE